LVGVTPQIRFIVKLVARDNVFNSSSYMFNLCCRLQWADWSRRRPEAFSYSSLQSILIPMNVEMLCSKCFRIVHPFHQSHLNQIHT
jgi:hypothetical protein